MRWKNVQTKSFKEKGTENRITPQSYNFKKQKCF